MRRLEQAIQIQAPLEDCFQAWVHHDNYPHFKALSSHKDTAQTPWRTFRAEMAREIEWTLMEDEPCRKTLWWHCVEDHRIDTSGIIHFEAVSPVTTQLVFTMTCNYPCRNPEFFGEEEGFSRDKVIAGLESSKTAVELLHRHEELKRA